MTTLADLQKQRDGLLEAIANGLLLVRDSNGEMVRYRDTDSLNTALHVIERKISRLQSGNRKNPVTIKLNKGY
ncbi:MAG: hypothetical protein F4Z31_06205 [Gemmatimonadetes bacterium]|nr:hypothetical protein [Gemmatimonadota bacterium]